MNKPLLRMTIGLSIVVLVLVGLAGVGAAADDNCYASDCGDYHPYSLGDDPLSVDDTTVMQEDDCYASDCGDYPRSLSDDPIHSGFDTGVGLQLVA